MQNDLISRSALLKELDGVKEPSIDMGGTVNAEPVLNLLIELTKCVVESIPAVDAVPVEKLGKWGKLFIPYKGCPRGHVGRMGQPATLEDEALHWGVITDVDGGRWVPVVEAVLRELIANAKAYDAASLSPAGRWERVEDRGNEDPVYKCSKCGQEVTADDGANIEQYVVYCPSCGAKMEG